VNLLQAGIQGAKVELTIKGVDAGTEFNLPPVRQVEVAVSQVDNPGRFQGMIYAVHGDQVRPLASLAVKRRGVLSIEGIGVGKTEIAGSTDSAIFVRSYNIRSTGPEDRVAELVITQLVGPDGEAVDTKIKLDGEETQVEGSVVRSVTIKAGKPTPLVVTVGLEGTGDYLGEIELLDVDARRREFHRPLKVTRSGDGSPSFTINPMSNKVARDLWVSATSAELNVTVTEKNREKVVINEIELFDLDLKEGQSRIDADRGGVTVRNSKGDSAASLTLPRNQTEALVVKIDGLSSPGEYVGTLRMTSGYFTPVDQTFTVFIGRSWVVALALIALGVGLGAFLRWLGIRRKQYQAQDRLGRVLQRVRMFRNSNQDWNGPLEGLRPRFEDLLAAIEIRIGRLNALIVRDPGGDWQAALSELERKVEGRCLHEWIYLARRAYESGLAPQLESDLDAVAQFIRTWDQADAKTGEALSKLDEIRKKLSGKSIKDLIADLRGAVEASRSELPATDVDAVLVQLGEAEQSADSAPEAARARYDEAWRAWIGKYIEASLDYLPTGSAYPLGFANQAAWDRVMASAGEKLSKARQAADPQAAMDQYRIAAKELLDALLTAFGNGLVGERAGKGLDKDTVPTDAAEKTYWDALNAGDEALRKAQAQLTAGDLGAARGTYTAAIDGFTTARAAYNKAKTGNVMNARDVKPAPAPPRVKAVLPALSTGTPTIRPKPELGAKGVNWKRIGSGLLWTALAIAVVGVLGLQVLWVNDPTWGSFSDLLIAFLWGIGLHTGSAVATGAAANRFSQIPGNPG
jgi:hypothetical protein